MSTKLGTILADFTTSLSTDLAIGGTSATLSTATDDDSVALPSGRYFFTLDGDNSNKEHISCDLVGTAITNIKSLSRQGVETTGVARKHRIGTSVSLTDFGHIKFINDLISGATSLNASAPLGYDGAPASLTGNQLATVTYVLGVVNGGAVTFDTQTLSAQTSGEALAVNDVVYFKESDARWYKVDADLTTTFDGLQMGINKTVAVGAGVTIQVGISGPMTGFSGLSAGSKYYASNTSGGISTSPGTYSVFVGWALTTTILLFTPFVKTLPTQKEKDALVGSTGIPSSTNKYTTQDNTTVATTDQTQTTQNGTSTVGEADTTGLRNLLAQSFIPSKTKIRGVNLYKSANTGTFTGTVTITLEADNAGSPSGTPLATVTITNLDWNAKAVGEFEALFSSEYSSLVAGSLYWIVIDTSTSDTSNHPNLGINTAGGYASGSAKYKNATDGWVAISTIDLYFKTLEGVNNQLLKTNSVGKIESNFFSLSELPVPAYYQMVGLSGSDTTSTASYRSTSNADGSVLYITGFYDGAESLIRLVRDSLSGRYYKTHSVTIATVTGNSITLLGDYLYYFNDGGANVACTRYLASDLTGSTGMTFGTAVSATSSNINSFTDGTYIYVQQDAGGTFHKESVSGTNFTQVTTVAVDGDIDDQDTCFFFDGVSTVFAKITGNGSTTNLSYGKFTDPTSVTPSTTSLFETYYQVLNTGGARAPIIAGIDSQRMYVGTKFLVPNTGTNAIAGIVLYPITKP